MKNLRQFQRYLEVKEKDDIVALGLFEAEMPTKKQKRSSSINGKNFEMKESNLKINRKINLELVTHTVLRSLKNLDKREVRS